MRDVPEPLGRLAPDAKGVGDVLGVCPGFHQPGGQRRCGAHGGPEPRQPGSRVESGEGSEKFGAGRVEPGQHLGSAAVAELGGDIVWIDPAGGLRLGERGVEFPRADRGADGGLVEVGEVADLVGDVPPGRGCRRVPPGLVEAGHQIPGDGGLGGEVAGERGHVCRHHVTCPLPRPCPCPRPGPGFCHGEDLAALT